jgi:hypothetical protein
VQKDWRIGSGVTVPGFRSSFRGWPLTLPPTPYDVCEAALVQINGKIPKWAYQRGDPFDKDRALTKNWSEYCCQSPPATSGCASVTPKRQRS